MKSYPGILVRTSKSEIFGNVSYCTGSGLQVTMMVCCHIIHGTIKQCTMHTHSS